MKPKTSQSNQRTTQGLKTAGNNIISSKKQNNLLLVNDIQKSPGNGLWCVNLATKRQNTGELEEKKDYNYVNVIKTTTNPNVDLEHELEKKMISHLKFQVQDLTSKLQSALSKNAEAEYRTSRSESNMQTYSDLLEKKDSLITDHEEKIDAYENTLINLNEALSNAKKEISRLQTENQNENEKCRKYYEMYQNLMIDRERKESCMSSEITNLMLKIQMLSADKENIMKVMRTQQIQNANGDNFMKSIEDKENTIRTHEVQMNKLINENAELKRKLNNEENLKGKLNEIIKKKKSKIGILKEELKSYRDALPSYTNEVKWNQELVSQRDNQIKIFKEKIKKSEEEIAKLNKEIEKLKIKRKNEKENSKENPDEEVCQVKAKPFLFGPENDDF